MFARHLRFRGSSFLFAAILLLVGSIPAFAADATPPSQPVKLIFIHHSTGQNWLQDGYGNLGLELKANNYFVSDTNYGWGPNSIGDSTDIPNWPEWFRSANTPTYMNALFTESSQHSSYTRLATNPGGENQIIMFKSCFPNSALSGNPNDPPSASGGLTVGHAKYVYNDILQYFATRPDKLFVVITAPPLQDGTYAANARAFNQWLINNWLSENNYTQRNVAVFDFYNVLTGPNNHHRYVNGAVEHVFTAGQNTLYYPTGDDHPSATGSQKATTEFAPLLNTFYNNWNSTFTDVAASHWAKDWINRLYNAGITTGCGSSPLRYCPEGTVTRAQMAVLVLRSKHGSTYAPPTATGTQFSDVPASHWAANWIEQFATEGITTGCGSNNYCPESPVTRAEMALFLLRGVHSSSYAPPAASGTMFNDVPPSHWAGAWIEQLATEAITTGCGGGNYCPGGIVTRAQMAAFLVRAFSLP
jgi:hypothetical protein